MHFSFLFVYWTSHLSLSPLWSRSQSELVGVIESDIGSWLWPLNIVAANRTFLWALGKTPETLDLCYFFFFFWMTLCILPSQMRSVSVDLNNDSSLLIDIPDALCERDKVKFTVHTKVKNKCLYIPQHWHINSLLTLIVYKCICWYVDKFKSVPRPHLALSRSQSSPFPGSMKTLFGYMTLWLRRRTMLE